MQDLALVIKNDLDTLAAEYEQYLREIGDYAAMSDVQRLEAARGALLLIAAGLESGDQDMFSQFIEGIAAERVAQGFQIESVQQAIDILVNVLEPRLPTLETANFLWRMMVQAHKVLSRVATDQMRASISERRRAEEELQASEERFRQLVEESSDIFFMTDAEGYCTYINPRGPIMTGYAEDELVGMHFTHLIPEEWKTQVAGFYLKQFRDRRAETVYQFPIQTRDGEILWVEQTARLLADGDQITGFQCSVRDITERRAAQDALRESEELFRSVVEHSPAGIFIIDNAYKFVYVNDQLCEIVDYPRDEVLGQNFQFFLDDESKAVVSERYVRRQRGEDVPSRYEFNVVRKNGEKRRVEISSVASRDSAGNMRTLAQLIDVTERRRAAEALEQSQQMLQLVMDNIPQTIFWKDRNLVYLGCNDEFAKDAGLDSPEDVIGKDDFDMPWAEQADLYRADDSLVMESGAPKLNYEEPQTSPDGSLIWLRTSKVPLRDAEGNVTAVLGMYEDITERKQMEATIHESLERRGRQVQTSTEVAQEIAAAPALDELYRRVVTLIKDRFGYYHTQLFLLEPSGERLMTVAGYGQVGEVLLEQGHSIPMGKGVVGRAGSEKRPVLTPDVSQDPEWLYHPLLPDTKGELAVPILLRDEVLGVLDVQSDQAGALAEEDQLLLEGLCGQIATAVDSTRLRQEMEGSLRELERLYGAMSRQGWDVLRQEIGAGGYLFDRNDVLPAGDFWVPEVGLAVEGEVFVPPTPTEGSAAVAPLSARGAVFGALGVQDDPDRPLSPDELALIESVAEQVSQALEGARLFDEEQRARKLLSMRVKELDVLNDIGREIDETPPIPELLQWTAERIPAAMQYPELCMAAIRFNGDIYGAARAVELPCQMVQSLYIGRERVGQICIAYTQDRDFLDEESALLGDVARRVSGFIENQRLAEQTRVRAEELAVLNELGQALTARLSVDEVLRETYRQTSRLLDTTNFFIALYDQEREEVHFAFDVTSSEIDSAITTIPVSHGLTGYIIRNRTPVLIKDNLHEQHKKLGIEMVGEPSLSWLGVPLIVGDQVLGAIGVHSFTTPGLYGERDRDLLTAIASATAIAIQSARLLEEAQARAERERLVRSITDRVRRGTDREDILRATVQELSQMLGASKAVVRLGTEEQLLSDRKTATRKGNGG
jgi:PAS domain S-box-containing protein